MGHIFLAVSKLPRRSIQFSAVRFPDITGLPSNKANPYTFALVESAFEDPLSFVPERWYSRPEMIRDKSAFAPFGVGKYLFSTPIYHSLPNLHI